MYLPERNINIIIDSLHYCQKGKGMEIFAWCIMTNYIHNNPVAEGFVFRPEDYVYSSAIDYCGGKELLDNVTVIK